LEELQDADEALRQQRENFKIRERQQASIAKLGQRALAGVDLPALMDEAVELVSETLEIEYCQILELLPDVDTLRLRAGWGWPAELIGQATMSVDASSQMGYTLLSGEPVIVEELPAETRFNGPSLLHGRSVVSGMSVIIDGQAWPFGVLGAHTTKRRMFSGDDINFLQAIANVLAQAIEPKGAEEALQESEERYRRLLELSFETIAIYSLGRFVYVNPSGAKFYGVNTAEELVGKPIADFIRPEHLELI
jgi:GAF domain-containing protein